jgi:hypothetical protein
MYKQAQVKCGMSTRLRYGGHTDMTGVTPRGQTRALLSTYLQHVSAVGFEETGAVAAQRVRARDLREYQTRGGLQVKHQLLK